MKKRYFTFLCLILSLTSYSVTWKVGATQTYTKPSMLTGLVQNGDTITFDAGVYLNDPVKWTKKNLVFIGLGTGSNRSIMRWNAGDIANGKGLWVFETNGTCDNAKIDNIVFDGARVSDGNGGNGAGIRYQAKNITINNCKFMGCQNGILEGGGTGGNVIIQNSEFFNNGYEVTGNALSGYEHHMYISASADTFILKNCYVHDVRGEGNSVKTRALRSYILNNVIDEGSGEGSGELNIAQGGLVIAMGNIIIQGPNSVNHAIVNWDAVTNTIEELYFVNNTVINKFSGNVNYFKISPTSGITVFKVYNNVFATVSGANTTWLSGTVGAALDSSKNVIATNYLSVGFVNTSTGDYHLQSSASKLIDKGTAAGNASTGYSLTPTKEYVAFTSALVVRSVVSTIDIGAYEFSSTGIMPLEKATSKFYVYADEENIQVNFSNTEYKNVCLYDLSGKKIVQQDRVIGSKICIPTGSMSRGLYFVSVQFEGGEISTQKFILK